MNKFKLFDRLGSFLPRIGGASFFAVIIISNAACDPEVEITAFVKDIKARLNPPVDKSMPSELKAELAAVETEPQKAAPEKSPHETAGVLAKAHAEFLAEMLRVIFDEPDVENKNYFGELTHTLNQGASLEGIYRGIIMGSRYRAMESKAQAAPPTELKAFAIEMAEIQDVMKNPTVFEPDESKKAPSIEFPDGSEAVAGHTSQTVSKKREKAVVRDELLQMFIGASSFTLKRVLGDEALRKIDESKDDIGELAQWYANGVIRLCQSKIDFGLELRNKPDFDLHFKFAQKMSLDRVRWEVLNRYHRYLNFTAKQK